MHFGSVAILAGAAPNVEALRDHVHARLEQVPRYRQRLAWPPAGLGRPRWIDDPSFNLGYHVRHTALPESAAGDAGLARLAGRIFSQRLDRSKPLWELWLVEGLDPDRYALVSKTHHCLVDGRPGLELLSTLFDREPGTAAGAEVAWRPRSQPGSAHLAARAVLSAARRSVETGARVAGTLARPGAALGAAASGLAGVAEFTWQGLNPAPSTPLNVPIGPHRRFEAASMQLDDLRAVKRRLGGTVNDVVLATLAGGLRRFLVARGHEGDGLRLRACVPVSVRSDSPSGALGNHLAPVMAPLPVGIADPGARLDAVKRAMTGLKESKQALGAEVLAGAQSFTPPTVLAQAARLTTGDRFYNLLVVNVPGPQDVHHLLGAQLQALYPVSFLSGHRALAVALTSYRGGVHIGLLADYDALPDLAVLADGVEAAGEELVALAGGRAARPLRVARAVRT
jgi:diacylglycerol O-acyltransferase